MATHLAVTGMPIALATALFFHYLYRRYSSPISNAPVATVDNPYVSKLGLVPPPDDKEEYDKLSALLIQIGQDPQQYPLSVSWSIFGTPLVFVNSLQGMKDILVEGQANSKDDHQLQNVQRGQLIQYVQRLVFGGTNINNTEGKDWRWRRHVLLPSFQPRSITPYLLSYIVKRTTQLLTLFDEHQRLNTALEVDGAFTDLTLDVINFYLYGKSDLSYDLVGSRTNLKNLYNQLGLGFQSPEAWLPFGLNKTSWAQRNYAPAREKLKMFVRDSIARAVNDHGKGDDHKDFHSVAISALKSGKYNDKEEELVNDFLSLTFAGYDTTAHTLSFCFAELAQHPDIQQKAFEQIRAVLGPPPIEPLSITAEKLSKLTYVTAIYREALRKYPTVVFVPAHVNHDTIVDGMVVPGGAEVWCNVRGFQMNPAIFPDPETFDPERWMYPDDKQALKDHSIPHSTTDSPSNIPDLVFSLGSHSCLGKNLAILELRAVIACGINEFTFTLQEGNIIDTKVVLSTKPRYGVHVHPHRRV